jgi:hypothetical protein
VLDIVRRQASRSRESPRAVDDNADADPDILAAPDGLNAAVLDVDRL